MNPLDKFFGDVRADLDSFTIIPLVSNCCDATAVSELFRNFGRCSDCYEMAGFTKEEL